MCGKSYVKGFTSIQICIWSSKAHNETFKILVTFSTIFNLWCVLLLFLKIPKDS